MRSPYISIYRFSLLTLVTMLFISGYSMVSANSPNNQSNMTEEQLKKVENDINGADLAPQSVASILFEADTGKIIYEKNMHVKLPPASVTKLMTMLLIMERLQQKKLFLTDVVVASEYAASMGGSQLYLEPGDKFTVDEMLKGIVMVSGNDASVAMAEHISGSEQAFVNLMNERARELGMRNTKFANSHGLPVENEMEHHYSTVYDIALMSRELLNHEKILYYTSLVNYVLTQNNGKPFDMYNSNRMLGQYAGMDGLKTGYTHSARHCLAATAKRDGMRLIAVVLGAPDKLTRTVEVSAMLDYGFQNFKTVRFVNKHQPLGVLDIYKGKQQQHAYVAPKPYSVLLKKNDNVDRFRHKVTLHNQVAAPIVPGHSAGKLTVYDGNKIIEEVELPLDITVEKAGFRELIGLVFRKLFFVETSH